MKKIAIILTAIIVVFVSCDKGFEELNVNPTTSKQASPNYKLTATMLSTSGERYEAWRANLIYQSVMMQHFASTAGYWSGDKYTLNRGYATSFWDRQYLKPVKWIENIIYQLKNDVDPEGNPYPEEMLAIARIWRVVIYQRLTDLYGDIPYSEAGKGSDETGVPILRPKYDDQKEIYDDFFKELSEAATVLKGASGTSRFGKADIIYNGDIAKWEKYANSMLLRCALRILKVDPANAKKWAEQAIAGGVMSSNADISFVPHTAGPEGINKNGNGETFSADHVHKMSRTFIDLLDGDPRLSILAQKTTAKIDIYKEKDSEGKKTWQAEEDDRQGITDSILAILPWKGLPNGKSTPNLVEEDKDSSNTPFSATNPGGLVQNKSIYATIHTKLQGEDAPMFFQTYAEVEFMLAECAVYGYSGAGDAKTHYDKGVTAAAKQLEIYGGGITAPDMTAYLGGVGAYNTFNGGAIDAIATQYWIVTFLNEYETFANWRRMGDKPALTPVNFPGNETNGTIPRRLLYPGEEQSINTEAYNAAIARQGENLFTTRVWWDKE